MSKAMLIMDMPSRCIECQFCDNEDFPMCEAGGRRIKDDNIEKRQEWCPLKEVPQKKEDNLSIHLPYNEGYINGWNDCIKEMLGEKES